MLKTRLAVAGAAGALLVGGVIMAAPAQATHMCDPDFQVGCTHPEYDLEARLDLLCDKFVAVEKVLDHVMDCGTD